MKDQCIDGAENGGVGANANGQCQYGNSGEARALHEIPGRVTDITEKRLHDSSSSSSVLEPVSDGSSDYSRAALSFTPRFRSMSENSSLWFSVRSLCLC